MNSQQLCNLHGMVALVTGAGGGSGADSGRSLRVRSLELVRESPSTIVPRSGHRQPSRNSGNLVSTSKVFRLTWLILSRPIAWCRA